MSKWQIPAKGGNMEAANGIYYQNMTNLEVQERLISIDEIITAGREKRLTEAFGTGTAAVISPVGELKYKDNEIIINDNKIGPIAKMVYDTITGVQSGRIEDQYGWVTKV